MFFVSVSFAFFVIISSVTARDAYQRTIDLRSPGKLTELQESVKHDSFHFAFYIQMPNFQFPLLKNIFLSLVPWYRGPNVCSSIKVLDDDKDSQQRITFHGFQGSSLNIVASTQVCTEDNGKYVCIKRVKKSGEDSKLTQITYQCCPGFKRSFVGQPGCVKDLSADQTASAASEAHQSVPVETASGERETPK